MKNLFYKELRLALHPTAPLFLLLAALLLIPNYPYYVTFFYMTLSMFFICLGGRENSDPIYSALLPVRKRDIVRARCLTFVFWELLQMLCCVPFAVLRAHLPLPGNTVGMDANTALFGIGLLMLGVFNAVFLTLYYRDVTKVGRAFGWGSAALFVLMAAAETLDHLLPVMRDRLDTPDPQFLPAKLAVLAAGALLYAALTLAGCRRAERSFEQLDL